MSDALKGKTLTQLRGIAQSFGIKDIFALDEVKLRQQIEMRQSDLNPAPKIEVKQPEYDSRLMLRPPDKHMTAAQAHEWVKEYVAKGLKFRTTEEQWFMSFDKKNDQGTLRMPPRVLLKCAAQVMSA